MRITFPRILGLCLFILTFTFNAFSQNGVSINTSGTVPDNSAILDLSAETDKGMILPKVALVSTIVAGPVALPATGILVWNTATAGVPPNDVTPGIYYNSGTPAAPVWARLATGAAASTDWNLDGNTNGLLKSIGTNDNFDFPIETNGAERMRVMTAGNVGIGTVAPNASALLDLTSASRGFLLPRVALTATNLAGPIAAPATGLMVYNTATAGVSPNNVTPGQYWWDGVKWVRYASGNIGWEITGNTGTTASTSAIGVAANNNFIGTTDLTSFVMSTNNLERMRITGSGNVGIGTLTPRGIFDVQTNGDIYLSSDPINGTGQSLLVPGFIFVSPFNGTNVSYLQARRSNSTGTTSLRIRTYNAGALTEAMHIEGNGNVGIGTITPNAALQFGNVIANRRIVLWEALNNDHQYYGFGINGNTLRYQTDGSGSDHVFFSGIGAVSSLELMRVKGNGQVAIGTAAPDASALLDVTSTNKGVIFPRVALVTTNVAGPVALPATGLMVYNTATAGAAPFNVMPGYYYNSGTPAAPNWKRFAPGNGDAWTTLGNGGTNAAVNFMGTTDAIDVVFRTNNTEKMRLMSSGRLGIGTAAPSTYVNILPGVTENGIYVQQTNVAVASYGYRNNNAAGDSYLGYRGGTTLTGGTFNDPLVFGIANSGVGTAVLGVTQGTNTSAAIIGASTVWNGGNIRTSLPSALALVGFNSAAAGASNGAGVYGGAAQSLGAGVWGVNTGPGGASFPSARASVYGDGFTGGSYAFAIFGEGGTSIRSGGVLGDDFGIARGALGYYASNFLDYAVYGFGQAHTNGGAGGMNPTLFKELYPNANPISETNTNVGIGIYGGMMGGWIRGLVYGTHLKGELYSLYVDGKTITNKPIINLLDNGAEERTITYGTVSNTADFTIRGKGKMIAGQTFITFPESFSTNIQNENIIVTISPMGECNGLFLASTDKKGFLVKELKGGNSDVEFTWIAVGTRKDSPSENAVSKEILNSDFDRKMDGVMFNEVDGENTAGSVWWDGTKMRFDPIPEDVKMKKYLYKREHIAPSIEPNVPNNNVNNSRLSK